MSDNEQIQLVNDYDQYEKLIAESKLLVVQFFSFCLPSQEMLSAVLEQSKLFPEVKFIKVNSDESKDIISKVAKHCNVIPFLFYKDGKQFSRIEDINPKLLKLELQKLTGKESPKDPRLLDTLEEYENALKTNKLLAIHFSVGRTRFDMATHISPKEPLLDYFLGLREKEQFKNITLLAVDEEICKEKEEIYKKANIKKFPATVFYRDGVEESKCIGNSKILNYENLEKFLGLPVSNQNPTNLESFNEFIKNNKAVVVCCLGEFMESPDEVNVFLEKFEKNPEYAEAKFIRVYYERSEDIMEKFGLGSLNYNSNLPSYLFFKEGKLISKYDRKIEIFFQKRLHKILDKPLPTIEGEIYELDEFEKFIKNNKLVALSIYNTKFKETEIEKLFKNELCKREELKEVKFLRADYTEGKEIRDKFGADNFPPNILIFKDGEKVNYFQVDKPLRLEKCLCALVGKPAPKEQGQVISEEEYEKIIKENKQVMCSFFENNTINDNNRLTELALEFSKEEFQTLTTAKIFVDENPELAKKYNCSSIPDIIFYKNGSEVIRLNGINHDKLDKIKKIVQIWLFSDENPPEGGFFKSQFHEHQLYLKRDFYYDEPEKTFICKKCNTGFHKQKIECWCCELCDFDFCPNCKEHEQKNEEIKVQEIINSQKHEHPLYFTMRGAKARCDICRRNIRGYSFFCERCTFDLCDRCKQME